MNPFGFAQRRVPCVQEGRIRPQKRRRLHDVFGPGLFRRVAISRVSAGAVDHILECRAFLDPGVGAFDRQAPSLATAALRIGGLERVKIEYFVMARRKACRKTLFFWLWYWFWFWLWLWSLAMAVASIIWVLARYIRIRYSFGIAPVSVRYGSVLPEPFPAHRCSIRAFWASLNFRVFSISSKPLGFTHPASVCVNRAPS